jgi:uncharacterized protein YukE
LLWILKHDIIIVNSFCATENFLFYKEGIMARIRVNTEDLKSNAKNFDSAAEAVYRAGEDIAALAAALPSYDGQLSGPARKAGYDIQTQMRDLKTCLAGDAETVNKAAQAYEEVDNRTIDIFTESSVQLSALLMPGGPGGEDGGPIKKAGNFDWLGYYDYGASVIFWRNGESISIIVTDENRELVEKYKQAVDEFCKNLADFLNTLRDMLSRGIGITQIALVVAILIVLGIFSPQIIGCIAASIAGLDAELFQRAIDDATEIAAHFISREWDEITEFIGNVLDPLNPSKYLEDIEDLMKYGQSTSQAYSEAIAIWNTLAPPSAADSTIVPIPTPPPTAKTPTPEPTPTETPPPLCK